MQLIASAIRKQKRNAVVKRQVAASLATVHEWPCLQKEPAVDDIDVESDDENYIPGCNGMLSIEERKGLGMLFATHEEVRIAIKVSYIIIYNESAESNWASIANDHHARWGIHKKTVTNVFKRMRDGDQNAEKQRQGAGQNRKLNKDNPGVIAAAAALNNGTPPKLAVYICNAVNER
jgi:hypothetical protein